MLALVLLVRFNLARPRRVHVRMRSWPHLVVLLLWLSSGCGGDGGAGAAADANPSCGADVTPAPGLVVTTSGAVQGVSDGATWTYKGIPYAAPPRGALRLAAPAPPVCTPGVRDGSSFGAVCPQLDDAGQLIGDEDCLSLNVWAPSAAGAPRPVMVWIHGGANVSGASSSPLYDGRRLAEAGDVVVVTINYRLGQLGFLAHAGLSATSATHVSGNYGILDQIAALAWVRDNAASFGGDAARVTIFGESAGARDVCVLLAAAPAAGLFQGAIMESGGCGALDTLADSEAFGTQVAQAAGCGSAADVVACLRELPVATLVKALAAPASVLDDSPYQPNRDGVVLAEQPFDAIAAGRHHHVPILLGANADETGRQAPMIQNDAQYQALVQSQFGPFAPSVLAQYPSSSFPTPRKAYVALTSDSRFICPSRRVARAAAAAQSEPVYRYFFTRAASQFGAVHGLEIPYLFGTFAAIPYTPVASDLVVSTAMQGAWTGFARSGDPNRAAVTWPRYLSDGSDHALVLDDPVSSVDGVLTDRCDFWDGLLP